MGLFSGIFNKTDNNELAERIKEGAFLVDVRTPAEFSSGSVKGAVNIPLNKVNNQLKKFKGKKNIVLFCASGARCSQAKIILENNSIENVYDGGTWRNINRIINK